MVMKIGIMLPECEFEVNHLEQIRQLGEVVFVPSREEMSNGNLVKLFAGIELLAADPDVLGGFEKATKGRSKMLLESLTEVKYVALSSTATGWIDMNYCNSRGIMVMNVPHYSTESVAEQTLGLIICLSKKIILLDRRTRDGKYSLEMGREVAGRILGVVGLGDIGLRVAQLGKALGMRIIGWNRTKKRVRDVEMVSLDQVLSEADVLSMNLELNDNTDKFLNESKLKLVKRGVIIVNLAMRELVDELGMAEALKSNHVESYGYWGEQLDNGPLAKIETAIGLKGFAYYTEESMKRAKDILVKNIAVMAKKRSGLTSYVPTMADMEGHHA